MADLSKPARANTHRRKVTGQMSISSAPSQPSPGASVGASGEPRLKARINPANIVGGSGSPAPGYATPPSARPGFVRAPSSASGRSDTGGRSTPRSDVAGPSSSRNTPALGQRPLVARAASAHARATPPSATLGGRRGSGTSLPSSAVHSGSSTPTGSAHVHVRRASSFVSRTSGGGTGSGGAGRSPQLDQGQFIPHTTTGSARLRTTAPSGTITTTSDSETPKRGTHGRSSSFQPGPRSDSGSSALSATATTSPKLSGHVSPPSAGPPRKSSRQLSNDSTSSRPTVRSNVSSPSMIASPSLATDTPRMPARPPEPQRLSSLHEVSASSENLTQYLAPNAGGMSSSLLSPSTLVPRILPSPPTLSTSDSALAHDDDDEPEPSSNHSSPARANRNLGATTPLHAHFAHLGLGPLAAASAPTSPGGSPRRGQMGLGLDDTSSLHRRRPSHLPWNPNHGPAPVFPPTPSSPELRTVALPIMTPVRSPEGSEHASLPGLSSRRYSSSSDASASFTGPRISSSPLAQVAPMVPRTTSNGSQDAAGTRGQWRHGMGPDQTSEDAGADYDNDDDDENDDRRVPDGSVGLELDENALEPVLSSDMDLERDKWERKIADLEISNASLLKINRMLEAQKAKQGSELVRLRRALRDARSGLGPLEKSGLAIVTSAEDEPEAAAADADTSGNWGDDEMEDPELEKRWDRLRDVVTAMRQRGEDAIERGREQTRPGVQRVLGWLEVEALGGSGPRGASPAGHSASTSQIPSRAASDTDPTEVSTPATAFTVATSHT